MGNLSQDTPSASGRKGTELLFCAQITNEYFKEGAGLDLTKAVLK